MKKTLIAIGLAAIIPVAVMAAGDHGKARHGGPDISRMAEKLELSAEQQEKVRALFEAHRAEREVMREKMRNSMAEVLTPEQQAKMESMREERKEKRSGKRGKRKHHRHGEDCGSSEGAEKS